MKINNIHDILTLGNVQHYKTKKVARKRGKKHLWWFGLHIIIVWTGVVASSKWLIHCFYRQAFLAKEIIWNMYPGGYGQCKLLAEINIVILKDGTTV